MNFKYILELDVATIEIISRGSIQLARERRKDAFDTIAGNGHLLLIELEGENRFHQAEAVKTIIARHGFQLETPPQTAIAPEEQAALWKHRKQLLPAVLNYRPHLKALSVVNDVGVAIDRLPDFILAIEAIFKRHQLHGAIYGHAGSGNLHLRPLFDTTRPDLGTFIRQVADEVYSAVREHDGTITAEHGMGRLRAPYLTAEWGEVMVGYMKRLKHIFDPGDRLNPDVIFSQKAITDHMKPLFSR